MPACEQRSSLSPPTAPEEATAPITSPRYLMGTPPPTPTTPRMLVAGDPRVELRAVAKVAEVAKREAKVRAVKALSWARVTVCGPVLSSRRKAFMVPPESITTMVVWKPILRQASMPVRAIFSAMSRESSWVVTTPFSPTTGGKLAGVGKGWAKALVARNDAAMVTAARRMEFPLNFVTAGYHFPGVPGIRKKAQAAAAAQASAQERTAT